MRNRLRFAAVGVGLAALLGAALGIGALVGDPERGAVVYDASYWPTGLTEEASAFRMSEVSAPDVPGRAGSLSFRITGANGAPFTDFEIRHEKPLHLIVARSDTAEFRHAHPEMSADGTWTVDWTWASPGTYRVFADFAPADKALAFDGVVLSREFTVGGPARAQPLPPPADVATVDGYEVRLAGALATHKADELRFTITRDGRPVTDLEPYLGAYAHLVGLEEKTLASMHAHPTGEVGSTPAGPGVAFSVGAPVSGEYRVFLEFAHGGSVHRAEFTVPAASTTEFAPEGAHEHGDGHR